MADKKKRSSNNDNENEDISKKRSYFDINRKKRTKNFKAIGLPILISIAIIAGITVYFYSLNAPPENFGALGSAHEHAAFLVKLDGTNIDFSQPKYQLQSDFIHVEDSVGKTLHRHANGVTFNDFLQTVNMDIDVENNCFVSDDGTQYCSTSDKKLRTFLNGNETNLVSDRVITDNDRILVLYGNETQDQIDQALDELNAIDIDFKN
ncbi:MAG: hypothetical protein ACPKPY_14375 [Nitrososphaeraceae archaeon]